MRKTDKENARALRVLHIAPSFYPATYWGGPIFSTLSLCDGIASEPGLDLSVLTTDAAGARVSDRVTERRLRFPYGYEVIYARRIAGRDIAPGLLMRLLPAIARSDLVHLTATYSFPTLPTLFACRLLGRPVVWSPRGAIQARTEWSGATSFVKLTFERIARLLAPRRTVLHVTSQVEARTTVAAMRGMAFLVIPNAVDIPSTPSDSVRSNPGSGPLRLLFLSRVHEKKGLELLFEAMVTLPDTILEIYGDGLPRYIAQLSVLAERLGVHKRVTFKGHVDGAALDAAYRSADLFVLPSYSENFGNVIAEALAYGVPVVTTTATPWEEVETEDCGRWVAPDSEAIRDAIADISTRDLATMGRNGRAYVTKRFSRQRISKDMISLYQEILADQHLARERTDL